MAIEVIGAVMGGMVELILQQKPYKVLYKYIANQNHLDSKQKGV